jgi:hypothetical protein
MAYIGKGIWNEGVATWRQMRCTLRNHNDGNHLNDKNDTTYYYTLKKFYFCNENNYVFRVTGSVLGCSMPYRRPVLASLLVCLEYTIQKANLEF